jgi:hypothetical protein
VDLCLSWRINLQRWVYSCFSFSLYVKQWSNRLYETLYLPSPTFHSWWGELFPTSKPHMLPPARFLFTMGDRRITMPEPVDVMPCWHRRTWCPDDEDVASLHRGSGGYRHTPCCTSRSRGITTMELTIANMYLQKPSAMVCFEYPHLKGNESEV